MNNFYKLTLPLAFLVLMSGCNSSDSNLDDIVVPPLPTVFQYQITVSNITNAQPFSPIAVLLHDTGEVWQFGQPASTMLEDLAESGDNNQILMSDFAIVNATNGEILLPGMQTDIMVSTTESAANYLSLATMLVNTNDAFTGLSRIDISNLSVDEMMKFRVAVYDAGTEGNSELAGTIPGPADGGEGFNQARDDIDYVARHPGVVSTDDGLANSVLNNQHKFDNPAMSVTIVRLQ